MDICFTEYCYCIYLWTYHTYPVSHRYYYFNYILPLHRYYYTWHQLCLLPVPLIHRFHWYTDTPIHWIPSSSLPGCSVHSYIIFVYHCYMYSLVYMDLLFLYSCHVDHFSYYMDYCYMYITIFPLHDCIPLLILIFPLLDMSAVDMWCVELSAT